MYKMSLKQLAVTTSEEVLNTHTHNVGDMTSKQINQLEHANDETLREQNNKGAL